MFHSAGSILGGDIHATYGIAMLFRYTLGRRMIVARGAELNNVMHRRFRLSATAVFGRNDGKRRRTVDICLRLLLESIATPQATEVVPLSVISG